MSLTNAPDPEIRATVVRQDLKNVLHPIVQHKVLEAKQMVVTSAHGSTIYDADGKLVPSPDPAANWNAVGMPMVQNHSACFNGDGSLDLYLQATAPPAGSKQFCNWLPTPAKGGYIAFLRMYWPADAILNKDWVPPGIVRN